MTRELWAMLLAAQLVTFPVMVAEMARERGLDSARAVAVVTLESDWEPAAVGDNGLAVGLWQFHGDESVGTWGWACQLTGHEDWADDVNRLDPVVSSIVALEMIALGWGDLWTGWRMTEISRHEMLGELLAGQT